MYPKMPNRVHLNRLMYPKTANRVHKCLDVGEDVGEKLVK